MTSPVSTLIDVGGANAIFNHMAVACAQCADVPNAGQCPQAQLHLTIVPGVEARQHQAARVGRMPMTSLSMEAGAHLRVPLPGRLLESGGKGYQPSDPRINKRPPEATRWPMSWWM